MQHDCSKGFPFHAVEYLDTCAKRPGCSGGGSGSGFGCADGSGYPSCWHKLSCRQRFESCAHLLHMQSSGSVSCFWGEASVLKPFIWHVLLACPLNAHSFCDHALQA
jgi:hypothetical protein